MKYNEYAVDRGYPVNAVRNALQALGQKVHPNANVDVEMLDKYFSDHGAPEKDENLLPTTEELSQVDAGSESTGEVASGEAIPVDPAPEVQAAQVQESPKVEEPAPVQAPAPVAAAAPVDPLAAAKSSAYGTPGDGKKLYRLNSLGGKDGKYKGEYFAWGYDTTTAMAEVMSKRPDLRKVHSGINWQSSVVAG